MAADEPKADSNLLANGGDGWRGRWGTDRVKQECEKQADNVDGKRMYEIEEGLCICKFATDVLLE